MFFIGIFHPTWGIQILVAPSHVTNQQMAELYGIYYSIKLATSFRWSQASIVNDNKGALHSLRQLQPRCHNHIQVRILRQIFNLLWWSSIRIHLHWVPSFLNPADPPSRAFEHPKNTINQSWMKATYTYAQLTAHTALPTFMHTLYV